jgi:hypothetical protein
MIKRATTFSTLGSQVNQAVERASDVIINGLSTNGFVAIPNFFSPPSQDETSTKSTSCNLCFEMRAESVSMFKKDRFRISQSTRWNESTERVEMYDKKNVYSMSLHDEDEQSAPMLYNYGDFMYKAITPLINKHFGKGTLKKEEKCMEELRANNYFNKLAVCTGKGSGYEKHLDNTNAGQNKDDRRKLTVILYLNPEWDVHCGGQFRVLNAQHATSTASPMIDPMAGTLLMFWSKQVLHSVLPSFLPNDNENLYRFAHTLWLNSG